MDQLGFRGENEQQCSSRGDDAERLERGVEHERPARPVSTSAVLGQHQARGYQDVHRCFDKFAWSSQAT
jgi:hypothetical protein